MIQCFHMQSVLWMLFFVVSIVYGEVLNEDAFSEHEIVNLESEPSSRFTPNAARFEHEWQTFGSMPIMKNVDELHLHGELGRKDAVFLYPPKEMAAEEDRDAKVRHHTPNGFNLARSESTSVDRAPPELRNAMCLQRHYLSSADRPMLNTSVIITFFNEPFSTLVRTVHSVLNASPPKLLHEVILIDDCSDTHELQTQLEEYLRFLPSKVKLRRLSARSGLMTARMKGAEIATGDTLTYLDSHVETGRGWLEPLMARVAENRRHVVMPVIDRIDADSFEIVSGGISILGWSWALNIRGIHRHINELEAAGLPLESPVMAGGLFSIDRHLFWELGAYDPGLKVYGGEEFELSFKIWQCGNNLECIPCSHVAHVFRSKEFFQGQAYKVTADAVVTNKLRVARVWMDEYAELVEKAMPFQPTALGDISARLRLRSSLNCRPFSWYLKHVFREKAVPALNFAFADGSIANFVDDVCLDTLGGLPANPVTEQERPIGLFPCHNQGGSQHFVWTETGELRAPVLDYLACVDSNALSPGETPVLVACHNGGGNQRWVYDQVTLQFKQGTICLSSVGAQDGFLKIQLCDEKDLRQKWKWKSPFPRQLKEVFT